MAHGDPLTVLIDQTIDGKYRVEALLGRGGMGAVFVGLVGALLYFAARRATGESMDRVLDDFERTTLPDTHWQRAHRDRVYEHLRTPGSRRPTTDRNDLPTATS